MTWERNGVTVQEDSDHETSQIIVDTSQNAVYENRLRVRGGEREETTSVLLAIALVLKYHQIFY